GTELQDPEFLGVTISITATHSIDEDTSIETGVNTDVETDVVTFHGTFSPYAIEGENRSMLYLGSGNNLYYPSKAMTIGAFRAFFQLNNDLTAGNTASGIRSFVLNFGDDTNGITEAEANSSFFTLHSSFQDWFTLDGRRLAGKPTAGGLYIHNGRKVVIK
ncbi:MAG: hypothetical protein IKH26_11190, partial [Bacteroidaceae bacterium]|nr:hypothetical protein [Bacteroidaceae bacterium]